MTHFHVAYGIAGHGPDGAEGFPTLDSAEALADYLYDDLSEHADMIHEDARLYAAEGDYQAAWETMERAEACELLRANLNPSRATAPLYVDNAPLWRETIERTVAESFPLQGTGASYLYVWDCAEPDCEHADDVLRCPECDAEVWDGPSGSKLAKCWNTSGHADGGTLAFDTMAD